MNIFGNNKKNILDGGNNKDNIFGRGDDDTLNGLDGNDLLSGGTGNDILDGGIGNDILVGGKGNDTLIGGDGNNLLTGGGGQDAFRLDSDFGVNTAIADFSVAEDVIQINRVQFLLTNILPLGTLANGKLHIGSGPADPDDIFTYDDQTGALFFDRDGSVSGPGFPTTQIAQLKSGLNMTNADIVLV